jgi:ribosomal protein S18 acetylase RimI-like enzyme
MTIRPAHLTDASSIAALSIEVWIGTYLKRGVSTFFADYVLDTFTTANTEKLISDPEQHILVSQTSDGINGLMRLSTNSPAPVAGASILEIATLYVQPRHHGNGIGKALLNAAISHAKSRNVASLWLTTNAENAPAIAFYLAQGFTKFGETHFNIGDEGYLNNAYLYRI